MAKKSLFNFYLDNNLKKDAMEKLERLLGETPKGALASFLRISIKMFIATPDDKVNKLLIEAIAAEYEYSQTLNKRSRL